MKKTSVFQNSLIWFGAGVSIAEILTGTYFAPLGMAKGFAAILLGHLIGCTMMFFAGLIGGRTGLSAMETSKLSFGKKGSLWFAALNVLQLVGWTAIMIYDGALAAQLGTRPTSAATTGWKKPIRPSTEAKTSSPTPSTMRPNTRLNTKIKTKISRVWRSAAFQMGWGWPSSSLCSSWQSTSSAWPV